MADTPEKDADYVPGPAGQEFLEEMASLKQKLENKPRYRYPKRKSTASRRKSAPSQPKIDRCFKPKTNEDGYPLKLCEFEPLENRMVYRPPGYADGWKFVEYHCTECHLKPCILDVYSNDVLEVRGELFRAGADYTKIAKENQRFFMRKLCKHMKKRYSLKVPVPGCVLESTENVSVTYMNIQRSFDVETDPGEESDDEEVEFGNTESGDGGVECDAPVAFDGNRGNDRDKLLSVPKWLMEESDVDESETDDDEPGAERAFLEGAYIPRSLLRDREVGDPPLEDVVKAHKGRVTRQQKLRQNKQEAGQVANSPRASKKRPIRKGRKKAARNVTKKPRRPFEVDLVSGLESDSSDGEEMRRISDEYRITCAQIESILSQRSL